MRAGEVWYANYPYEDDPNQFSKRPSIILDVENDTVTVIKVTSHGKRTWDSFDVPIVHWEYAGLNRESTARVAKMENIDVRQILNKKGNLHPDDEEAIAEAVVRYLDES